MKKSKNTSKISPNTRLRFSAFSKELESLIKRDKSQKPVIAMESSSCAMVKPSINKK